jgi:hypothetical protein
VQVIIIGIIVFAVTAGVALFAVRSRHAPVSDGPWSRIALGVVPGLIGIGVVGIAFSDLVPDQIEGSVWLAVAVAVGAAVIIGRMYLVARD